MRELLSCHSPSNLLAYLDGGTGSMLLQAAIASLLAASYMAKQKWAQLRTIFSKARKSNEAGQ